MEEKDKGEVKEQKRVRDFRYYLVQVLILLAVVALGLLVVNQVLEYRYKSVFLQTPCNVCKDLNANQSICIDNCFKYRIEAGDNSPSFNIKEINFTGLAPTSP